MKSPGKQLAFAIVAFGLLSCQQTSKHNAAHSFSLELVDSITVDYLGEMTLIDYDDQADKYLLADNSGWTYLEVDTKGQILNQNHLSSDGPNAVPNVSGLGFLNGEVTVLTQTDGFYRFRDSTKIGEIPIPYPYRSVVPLNPLGIFAEGNRVYYPKPWPQTIDLSSNGWDFYKQLYALPLIESLDLDTRDTFPAVQLPESSVFLDGRVHGIPFPSYTRFGDLLLVSMSYRPEFHVYQKDGKGFRYLQTVAVNVSDWASYDPVEKQDAERFYNGFQSKQIGILHKVLHVDGYYLAVYSKGIPEEKMPDRSDRATAGLILRRADPFFAAVFDQEFKQLASDIPFPAASNRPLVVNKNGELVVSKVAAMSETEDEGIILYKLKVKAE